LAKLQDLASQYPDVIVEVRGQGLLLALELRPRPTSSSFLFRLLSDQSDLGFLVMAYLLHAHRIRVAPTLSRPMTLRLQPSLLLEESEQVQILSALADVCQKLRGEDVVGLAKVLGTLTPLPVSSLRRNLDSRWSDRSGWPLSNCSRRASGLALPFGG
jgi:hypothetical protein